MSDVTEALQLLTDGGVIGKLKDDAQAAREAERAELLVKLEQVEQAEAARAAELAKVRPALLEKVATLTAELETAKRELNALAPPTGFTVEKLRGKLRALADPRIAGALAHVSDLGDKARHAFLATPIFTKKLVGGRAVEYQSNADRINDVQAAAKAARHKLEVLQEAERPADLDKVLAEIVDPIKIAVQRLHGLH